MITFDPSGNFQTPLLYDWNLAVQQQITPTAHCTGRVRGLPWHAHLFTNLELNPAVQMGAADTAGNEQARRLYQNFASISETEHGRQHQLQFAARNAEKANVVRTFSDRELHVVEEP